MRNDAPHSPPPEAGDEGAAISNALPPGMRDLLPPKARFQSQVGREIMAAFERFGYERVWLPTFEYASVLERSRSAEGAALKFIEPETGEVVALRSDMTPQIARVVATRFRAAPRPVRLCYQGSVLRRRKERARTESQVVQAGAELVGKPGIDGDFEVLEMLCAAVRASRLEEFVVDVGHSGIAASLSSLAPPDVRAELREALAAKDVAALERVGEAARLEQQTLRALVELPELHGGRDVWPRARRVLRGTAAEPHMLELEALWARAAGAEIAPRVLADLGETRDVDYYTGTVFQLLAHGPGEPVASGGRYDALYQRFGASSAAAGFAIDLNHLCWALSSAGAEVESRGKLALETGVDPALVSALRALGVRCALADDAREYAEFWHYDFVAEAGENLHVAALEGANDLEVSSSDPGAAAREIAEFIARAS